MPLHDAIRTTPPRRPTAAALATFAAAALAETELPDGEVPDAVPHSLVELLERIVAAIDDDPLGRRLRLSLLTTVQTAAAEAGRSLPIGVHELRARVLRGSVAWVGSGATIVDDDPAAATREALSAVASAIRVVQRQHASVGGYDDLFAPLHDEALSVMLRRAAAAVRGVALGGTSGCVVTPPIYGRHLVLCDAESTGDSRRLALRRALAHIACGHVGEHAALPFPEPPPAARAADLFALADLVPFWQIHEWRRGARLGWRRVMQEVAAHAAALAGDWDAARADEAGRLRVLLYREHGL